MRIDSTRGTGDDSMRLMRWKYGKTCGVGGSGVMFEFYQDCYMAT